MRNLLIALTLLAIGCAETAEVTTTEAAPTVQTAPATAVQATAPAPEAEEVVPVKYVCPMCDGVESDGPGECPGCGMALLKADEAAAGDAEAAKDAHADCPHHAEGEECDCEKKGEHGHDHGDHGDHADHADCPHAKAAAEAAAAEAAGAEAQPEAAAAE